MLDIIIGLPGTGKSTVSKLLAEKHNATILNADEFRKTIFHIDESKKDQIFPQEWRDIPYRAIFIRAKKMLENDINVIIDAALYSQKLINEAKELSVDSKVIKVICPEKIVKQRLKERVKKSTKDYSAGTKVYDYVKSFTGKTITADFVIDTSKELAPQLDKIE